MARKAKKVRGVFEKVPGSEIWWVRYADATGRIRREKAGTRSAAVALCDKRRNEARAGRKLPENLRNRPITFAALADVALTHSKVKHVKRYQAVVRQHVRRLKEWFGERSADALTPSEIETRLDEHTATPATFNRYKATLSLIYRLAVNDGKVTVNPARRLAQKRENNARIRFLSDAEEQKLREVIRKRYPEREPEFDFGIYTGMRRSEQYGSVWRNVDFAAEIITIPRSKHGKARYMPINSGTRRGLEALLRHRQSEDSPVCPGGMGRKGYLNRWFFECAAQASLYDINWHTLRHTYISRLVMRGVDIRSVQELAGHRTIQMTMRYAHLAPGHLREASEKAVSNAPRAEVAASRVELEAPQTRVQTDTTTDTGLPRSAEKAAPYVN